MPDRRKNRGAHPEDCQIFAPQAHDALRAATSELSWLLSRGYSEPSALKLVGDRHALVVRQRQAVMRCACSDTEAIRRINHEAPCARGATLAVDGFNLLILLESALSGGIVLVGRDGAYRDMASIHGSYRRVVQTSSAIALLGRFAEEQGAAKLLILLDRPVSNSGRLAAHIREEIGHAYGGEVEVELVTDPDPLLAVHPGIVVTGDGWILDRAASWTNAAEWIVAQWLPEAWVLDLGPGAAKT